MANNTTGSHAIKTSNVNVDKIAQNCLDAISEKLGTIIAKNVETEVKPTKVRCFNLDSDSENEDSLTSRAKEPKLEIDSSNKSTNWIKTEPMNCSTENIEKETKVDGMPDKLLNGLNIKIEQCSSEACEKNAKKSTINWEVISPEIDSSLELKS